MDPEEVLLRNVIAESLREARPGLSDEEFEQQCEESFNVLKGM
jgi:hypothetical protein